MSSSEERARANAAEVRRAEATLGQARSGQQLALLQARADAAIALLEEAVQEASFFNQQHAVGIPGAVHSPLRRAIETLRGERDGN